MKKNVPCTGCHSLLTGDKEGLQDAEDAFDKRCRVATVCSKAIEACLKLAGHPGRHGRQLGKVQVV